MAKGGMHPGSTVQGAAFGWGKYGILKFGCFWPIGICIAMRTAIFLHPQYPIKNNTPEFWYDTSTVSAPRPHTKQCVHQETYTTTLTEHSPAAKL